MHTVVGGTGFIGSAVVRELRDRDEQVAVVSRSAEKVAKTFPGLGVIARECDVRDSVRLSEALKDSQGVVIALAFDNYPMEDPSKGRTFEEVDQKGAEAVASVARQAGVEQLVYLSGAGSAPDARYHWFRAKWKAEQAVRSSGVAFTILRPSWVYGPGDRSLNRMLGFGRVLPFIPVIGDGSKQMLQPVFIDDIARAVADSLEKSEARNQVLEIGGPEVMPMDEVVKTALDVSEKRRLIMHQPKGLMKLAAAGIRLLPGPPLTPDGVEFAAMPATVDNSALHAVLGTKPRPLREGLETYLGPGRR
ncbi:MAG TPA: NAD(P)H-binding protein [Dehalococcoidia bacterium]|nr:NAD(P)H-binding protein [Dehalococcoidia bacterium]